MATQLEKGKSEIYITAIKIQNIIGRCQLSYLALAL